MTHVLWSQDVFSKGEISPLMYARVSVSPYYNGLKTASNVITFPQGAAGKRFGTFYQNTIAGVTKASDIYFKSMQYLNECVYLITFVPGLIYIYLEGVLVFTVTVSSDAMPNPLVPYLSNEIRNIKHTVLDNIFRTTTGDLPPQDLTRAADTPVTVTGFNTTTNVITVTASYYTAGLILPVRFTFTPGLGNRLFGTNPQIIKQRTYFLYFLTATTAQIYSTAIDAKAQINPFLIIDTGVGAQQASTLNAWSIASTFFTNYPTFDFQEINYSTTAFAPADVTGYGIVITASAPVFTPANAGGVFQGNSGIARILSVTDDQHIVVNVIVPFENTNGIPGSLVVLTEPVWSDDRGWPRICSSFQNRALFGNTDLLPNGLWSSVTNDYNNFDDSEQLPDSAISWYPTSDDINFIRFIVPYRSLTIHTNSGVFSTPLSVEQAITPLNFSLTIQDSTPADVVQPRGIDNQIIILSGNDAHSLLWDGFNNAYQSNIISIANEQLIRDPIDEAAFVDLTRAGSRYMLIVNTDGSLAIYQTLISEDVQGFTPAILQQSYGNAYFRWVTTNFDGRGWFVTERQIAFAGPQVPINTFTQFTLGTSAGFNLLNGQGFNLLNGNPFALLQNDVVFPNGIFAFQFENVGTLPLSSPQVMINTWYWAVPTDSLDFKVYLSIEDAETNNNPIQFFSAGVGALIIPWLLETQFMIEELSFEAKVDCAFSYNSTPSSTFAGLPRFDAQEVKIQGDGYGFTYTGIADSVQTIAHGVAQPVSLAQIGFPINVTIEPLPLSIFQGNIKGSDLLSPKHIREVSLMLSDTIGGLINGIPIGMSNFADVPLGIPPVPIDGIFEYGIMAGWDDFKQIGLTITHNEPFDIKLIGLFYRVEA